MGRDMGRGIHQLPRQNVSGLGICTPKGINTISFIIRVIVPNGKMFPYVRIVTEIRPVNSPVPALSRALGNIPMRAHYHTAKKTLHKTHGSNIITARTKYRPIRE